MAKPGNRIIGRDPEKINAHSEKYGINNAGYQDPLPQFMFADKVVGVGIGLYGDNDFFEQTLALNE